MSDFEPTITPPPVEVQEHMAKLAAKEAEMIANLPTWQQVSDACDGISNLAEAKAFLKKLSRVVWLIARSD